MNKIDSKIRKWDAKDLDGLMKFIKPLWAFSDWGWHQEGNIYYLSTAGFSDNEEIIYQMRKNSLWWLFNWQQSRRGGHYIFCKSSDADKTK